jgi:hypothetical protein
VNFGVGIEHRLGERYTLYGGVARNASPWREESETVASWDLTDVTAGVTLNRGRSRLAFGVGYAWGKDDLPQLIAPPGETGQAPAVEATFRRLTFSVGVSLGGSRP